MRDYQFGEFIYELRTERNLSQSKLGELVGVSNKAVSKWENGASKPSMDTLKKLADIFGVSIDELLEGRRFSAVEPPQGAEAGSAEAGSEQNTAGNAEKAENPPEAGAPCESQSAPARKKRAVGLAAIILSALLVAALAAVSVFHIFKFNVFGGMQAPPAGEETTLEAVKKSVVKIYTNLGTGSGFCAFKDNLIVTNYHVIENTKKIYIIDDDGKKNEIGKIVFYDKEKDIAVLQARTKFEPIELGDGKALKLQDGITVIGSPQGVLNTVSVGIISNVSYKDYIVISAPISPGSSGGVLLNEKLQAIGIITATAND